ncbi:mycofactocin system transcriptional regulator [Nesterenkonia ebinurensis]|uniref:mycofactocin system transcriptional regulator n=1 Tax=Nesterenkonia ebinurensis TaxID=2608252 RepID=UPI001CC43AAD|nr:mycofactocin system transcriptional regulator [Nesterenkonia ebinurensis]
MRTDVDAMTIAESSRSSPRGRTPLTSKATLSRIGLELFIERGFDQVTVDDIAEAAGIGRRTFFRYFPSKNDLPWGDFEALLDQLESHLDTVDHEVPLFDALRTAVSEFNRFPGDDHGLHRKRMELLLKNPTLVAHSTIRYEAWRAVIADFAGRRLDKPADHLQPKTIGQICLGISVSAHYEWLEQEDQSLPELIDSGFRLARDVFLR